MMKNFNWKVRFSKDNLLFILRFAFAVISPALAFLALEPTDLGTWEGLGNFFMAILSNPYLIAITVLNAVNLLPDPTTKGFTDSEIVLNKTSVK
jgi:phi LC3 family holin